MPKCGYNFRPDHDPSICPMPGDTFGTPAVCAGCPIIIGSDPGFHLVGSAGNPGTVMRSMVQPILGGKKCGCTDLAETMDSHGCDRVESELERWVTMWHRMLGKRTGLDRQQIRDMLIEAIATARRDDPRADFATRFAVAAETIPSPPKWTADRGIVICAGGWRFFPSLFVTVSLIRQTGCQLPIQVWHLDDEFHPLMAWYLRDMNVQWVNAPKLQAENPQWQFADPDKKNLGWATKSLAAAACPFREVISFDADCYPIGNPESIFDSTGFRETGAVFFPDLPAKHSIMLPRHWQAFGMDQRDENNWESGQFAFDKSRQWPTAWLSFWLNSHSRHSYKHVYGDKDTFHVAWRKLDAPVALHPDPPIWRNVAFIQRLPDGTRYSVHRCRDKFRLDQPSFRTPQKFARPVFDRSLPREDDAHEAFRTIKALHSRPSLLIVGHPRGGTTLTAEIASKACNLMPHPASQQEAFNTNMNSEWSWGHYTQHNERAYRLMRQTAERWRHSALIKDVVQPHMVARLVRENPGMFNVIFVDREPHETRVFQVRKGWGDLPHPSQHADLLRSIADATVKFDDLLHRPDRVFAALADCGYEVEAYDYRDSAFCKKRQQTLDAIDDIQFEIAARRNRLPEDVSMRGEYTVIKDMIRNIACSRVVVDVGAKGKRFSNSWNLINDGWRGVLVEPEPTNAAAVRSEFVGDFAVEEVAVSDHVGTAEFYVSKNPGWHSLLKTWKPEAVAQTITVPVVTLPQLLQRHQVPNDFGVLSIDTEGHDAAVLAPLLDSQWRPRIVIVERHGWSDLQFALHDRMVASGYELHGAFGSNWIYCYN